MKNCHRILKILSLAFLFSGVFACAQEADTVPIRLGEKLFRIEVADTPSERQKGLMYRKELAPDGGMIFVFEKDEKLSFWMKNTLIPLSIAFIAKDGTIKEIYDMTPGSTRPIESTYMARFALELQQGAYKDLGIEPGYRIELPPDLLNKTH